MNKLILLPIVFVLSGCLWFQSPERPGYQAGRTTAVIWMTTENIQQDRLHNASKTGYRVLQAIYASEVDSDMDQTGKAAEQLVRGLLGEDASEVQVQLVMNFYTMAFKRLDREITDQASRIVVLANLTSGIQDALEDYR